MASLQQLQRTHAADADFLCVYIAEAHATDEWPMGEAVSIRQATALNERLAAANEFIEGTKFSWPVVSDRMDNGFNKLFGAWPTRFYVVEDNRYVTRLTLLKVPRNGPALTPRLLRFQIDVQD